MNIINCNYTGELPLLPKIADEFVAFGKPEQRGIDLFTDAKIGLSVGIWACTPWNAQMSPYSVDEFIILKKGSVKIHLADGRSETMVAGDSFFIPKGLNCAWEQSENVEKIYVIFENGIANSAANLPLKIDINAKLSAIEGPLKANVIGNEPLWRANYCYDDASEQFSVGLWSSTPYTRRTMIFPRHELMFLLQGEVIFTIKGEKPQKFQAGDIFFMPMGCEVDWVNPTEVRKIFCSIMPI